MDAENILAIDIQEDSLTLTAFCGKREHPAFSRVALPMGTVTKKGILTDGLRERITTALNTAVPEPLADLKKMECLLVVPLTQVFSHMFLLPAETQEPSRWIIDRASEIVLGDLKRDFIFAWKKQADNSIFFCAIQERIILDYLKVLRDLGFTKISFFPEVSAIQPFLKSGGGSVFAISLEMGDSGFILFEGKETVKMAVSCAFGLQEIAEAAAKTLAASFTEAGSAVWRYGFLSKFGGGPLEETLKNALEPWAKEVDFALRFSEKEYQVKNPEFLLYGNGSSITGVSDFIKQRFLAGLVRSLDPWQGWKNLFLPSLKMLALFKENNPFVFARALGISLAKERNSIFLELPSRRV